MDLQIRQVDELIKYYEDELLYNSKQEQSNIKDRNYVLAQKYKDWNTIILEFIDNLKNLKPNESKTVNRNERAKRFCCYCGAKLEHEIYTDANSKLVCKSGLCKIVDRVR